MQDDNTVGPDCRWLRIARCRGRSLWVQWASYQVCKIAGCACAGNAGDCFSRHQLQRKPLVSNPGMHDGTCVMHVPWCMSGLLTPGGGGTFPAFPAHAQPSILHIWQEVNDNKMQHFKGQNCFGLNNHIKVFNKQSSWRWYEMPWCTATTNPIRQLNVMSQKPFSSLWHQTTHPTTLATLSEKNPYKPSA